MKTSAGADPSVGSPIAVNFRSATGSSGSYDSLNITSALSFVVSSGSRVGYQTSFTGDTTNTNATVLNVTNAESIPVGATITGTGIPAATTVLAVSGTTLILSAAATATNSGVTLTIGAYAFSQWIVLFNDAGTARLGIINCRDGKGVYPLAAYGIVLARRMGVPGAVQLRMIANVALDATLGAVPVAGDLFDAVFKAHQRNHALLERWLGQPRRVETMSRLALWAVPVAALLAIVATLGLAIAAALWSWDYLVSASI